ncbi:MAG: hypothetical protein SNF33_03810 [Candidatus Algichlamydia australiensis]|nr:hypothetical protein [Chlamydiales bacterium]
MTYKDFLDIVCRLYENRIAKIFLEDQLIEVRWAQKNLTLVTKIFTGKTVVPSYISDSLSSRGKLNWEENKDEIYMDASTGDLFYKRTLSPSLMFTYLRTEMKDFLEQVHDWKNHFQSRSTKERLLSKAM